MLKNKTEILRIRCTKQTFQRFKKFAQEIGKCYEDALNFLLDLWEERVKKEEKISVKL